MQVNLLPFVIEALGANKKIYKDIDRIYQENKYEYYKAAKEHELYNHPIVKEGSLIQEEYCKKALGILIGPKDEKLVIELEKLFKRGFRYTYTYAEKHLRIDLSKFIYAFMKKYCGEEDENGINIEYHTVVLLFLAINKGREIIENDTYKEYLSLLSFRWEHYGEDNEARISLGKATEEDKQKIKELKQAIYKEYGEILNFNDILQCRFDAKGMDAAAYLFDYENISSISLFEDIKFTSKNIDEILYLYVLFKEDLKDIEKATKFLVAHMYIRYMIKAYKQVKEMYFKNNKETMYVELEGLEKSLNSATEKLFSAKQEITRLQQQIEVLEKENRRLQSELAEERKNRNELNSLREFMFNLDRQEEYTVQEEVDMEFLKKYKAVLIGGHEKWQQRMKELLPNFIFIHPDQANFDTKILDSVDIIFIYVNYLNHGIYYRAMNAIEGKNVKVAYLNQQNEEMVLKNIYKEIKALEKI